MRNRLAPLIAIAAVLLVAACGVDPATPTPTRVPIDTPAATPLPPLEVQCMATKAYALEHLVAVIGEDPVPTAFDAINGGGCDFSEPIVLVEITLRNDSGEQIVEVVIAPQSHLNVPFGDIDRLPLVDSGLAPGRYERTVEVYAADGRSSGAIAGFGPVLLVNDVDGQQADLLRAQSRWERGLQGDYVYQTATKCFCMQEYVAPVDVTVIDGEVVSVVYATDAFTGEVPEAQRFTSVDGLFAFLQDAIDRDAVSINVTYDGKTGYPTSAFVDYSAQMADEEQGFTATNIRPLP